MPRIASPWRAIQVRSSWRPGERIQSMKPSNVPSTCGTVVGMSCSASLLMRQSFVHLSGSESRSTVSTLIFWSRIFFRDSSAIASSRLRFATRSSSQNRPRRSSRKPRFAMTSTRSVSCSQDHAVNRFAPSARERSSIAAMRASTRAGVRCEGSTSPDTLPKRSVIRSHFAWWWYAYPTGSPASSPMKRSRTKF